MRVDSPGYWTECPGCGGQKTYNAVLCKKCWTLARSGENHPMWKGGPRNECPLCGGSKSVGAETCWNCFIIKSNRFEDYRHIKAKEWQKIFRRTPEGRRQVRAANLKKYGITPEQYDEILERQGGVCAACGQPETHRNQWGIVSLAVDHDHDTGIVRGLLCGRCNRALGLLGDSVDRIDKLLRYRRFYEEDLL